MAIMKRCCCCGIRQGSIACGVYSMVTSGIAIMMGIYQLIILPDYKDTLYQIRYQLENQYETMGMDEVDVFGDLNIDGLITGLKAEYWYSFLCNGLVFVTSALLIKGIKMDRKEWLIPFMAARAFYFTLYIFATILSSYTLSKMGMQFAGIGVAALLIVLIPGLIIDLVIILCVYSQYQEYRDGRGRQYDEVAFTQHDEAQTAGTKGFSYQHMPEDGVKDAPPPYDAP